MNADEQLNLELGVGVIRNKTAESERSQIKRTRITNEIKAICNDECFPFRPNTITPLLDEDLFPLLDLIERLDVDALESAWLSVRYEYKIMDEDIKDAVFFASSQPKITDYR